MVLNFSNREVQVCSYEGWSEGVQPARVGVKSGWLAEWGWKLSSLKPVWVVRTLEGSSGAVVETGSGVFLWHLRSSSPSCPAPAPLLAFQTILSLLAVLSSCSPCPLGLSRLMGPQHGT